MTAATGLIIGYHGCERRDGEDAIAGSHPRSSTNPYDWLGHGLYFWENDPDRALHWASTQRKAKQPFVLGAVIALGHCLDLVEAAHLELLREAHGKLRNTYDIAGKLSEMPRNEKGFSGDADLVKRNLDCAVINYLHDLRQQESLHPFDTVRSPFSEGTPLYEGAGIMSRTHIQICVRDPKTSIIGYFRLLT